jgi:pimeloyl-ACP methyl ester carboxylesterase
MIIKVCWISFLAGAALCAQSGVEGTWQGTLDVGAIKLRLGLHVSKNAEGQFTSKLDSIDQSAMGIPVKVTTFADKALHLELPNLHATYDGKLSADGSQISGTFVQGAPVPLVFRRVEKVETLNRPQNPKPPYPYDAQDVAYETSAGIKLAGTLTLPRGPGPFPAAIMITGSGPQDRDEALMGHKPFLVIADYLTRRGIAVLRLDDRGVGGSTGNSMRETLDDMAGDVVIGVGFLKGRKEIDARHIGVIGHSEGGIVGPAAAVRSPDIAFVIMLAGTGVVGTEVLKLQGEAVIRASGGSDQKVAEEHAVQDMIFRVLQSEQDDNAAIEKMMAEWKAERKSSDASDDVMRAQFKAVTSPELRSFLFYDPSDALHKLKVPVLALNGSHDVQVPPQQNLPAIAAALAAAGNTDYTVSELPGLNHLFQKCNKCTVQEYGELEETFSPTALEIMGDWLVRHTRAQ